MLKVWNVSLIIGDVRAVAARHVPRALGHARVDPRVRRLDARHAVPDLHRASLARLGRRCSSAARATCARRRGSTRSLSREAVFLLNNLVLVGLCVRDLLGHLLPADLRGADGQRRRASGRRGSTATPRRSRSLLVLLAGIGPMLAWRRVTLAGAAARSSWPPAIAPPRSPRCSSFTPPPRARYRADPCSPSSRSCSRRSARSSGAAPRPPEMTGEPLPRALVRGSWRATAAATAATSSTSGSRCCSSAWPPPRRSTTSATRASRRASRPKVGDYTLTYVKPTAELLDDRAGTGAPITLGAVVDVAEGRQDAGRCDPARNYYTTADGDGGRSGASSRARRRARWTSAGGCAKDFWLGDPARPRDARRRRSRRPTRLKAARDGSGAARLLVVAALAERYRRNPPPAQFRAIVSPLVAWIWIGGRDRPGRVR